MTLGEQILWGSGFLGLCLVFHVVCLAFCTQLLDKATQRVNQFRISLQIGAMLLLTLGVLVFAVTVQVWIWAIVWVSYDVLPDWNSAVYFSLVTFTSLGYGDIVLGPGARIFASFASVTGLLSFGLSTAFLVAMMSRVSNDRTSKS